MDSLVEKITYRNILGVRVACFDWDSAFAFFEKCIDERRFLKQGWLNAHIANITYTDHAFKTKLENFLILPDGIGVDIASKAAYGAKFPANLNGTDFIPGLLQHIQRPLRVALLGGKSGVPEEALAAFRTQSPQHDYRVVSDGYFKPDEVAGILERLTEFHPDILLVAMGAPRQELFIDQHITARHCTIASAVGALLDFQSGRVERAPQWIRNMRMEWAYRLLLEPKRLMKRYLVGNPLFLWRVARHRLSGEKR
ncbi:WecB/TagA/CpsF family glycosyltransferase [Falsochrobactrum sp. TDYN1]|uniref:WecB/TagA/CpsF family glycosyltransferase n=1 Tax=Falsochrobactrum tianjinense TaxID=2706015 RepID=A0A949PP83_9HYPH|nr:WecB/TagA/CpsF family glycosyltransferase [Falsochrobactrum sp. TDYN1]MBV2144302.1 WecB/TagA/CpsF family glycosyltransferase [Falsochrobactrum sp. TDYN1]